MQFITYLCWHKTWVFCLYFWSTDHLLWIFYFSLIWCPIHLKAQSQTQPSYAVNFLIGQQLAKKHCISKSIDCIKNQTPTKKSLKHSIWYQNRIGAMKKHIWLRLVTCIVMAENVEMIWRCKRFHTFAPNDFIALHWIYWSWLIQIMHMYNGFFIWSNIMGSRVLEANETHGCPEKRNIYISTLPQLMGSL